MTINIQEYPTFVKLLELGENKEKLGDRTLQDIIDDGDLDHKGLLIMVLAYCGNPKSDLEFMLGAVKDIEKFAKEIETDELEEMCETLRQLYAGNDANPILAGFNFEILRRAEEIGNWEFRVEGRTVSLIVDD